MKMFIHLFMLLTMASLTAAQSGKASTLKTTFSRTTTVSIDIRADLSILWALLTNADDFPRWNHTILSMEGSIVPNGKIRLKSALDPKRTFKLRVKTMEPERLLVWGDRQGNRTFTLEPQPNEQVRFTMTEKIGGWMFPMYAKYLPPFDASFEQFAADLKREAESIHQTKN
jgi:uncharacterized protein YndB with AHSA1/START domain